jgi:hypothetical protein
MTSKEDDITNHEDWTDFYKTHLPRHLRKSLAANGSFMTIEEFESIVSNAKEKKLLEKKLGTFEQAKHKFALNVLRKYFPQVKVGEILSESEKKSTDSAKKNSEEFYISACISSFTNDEWKKKVGLRCGSINKKHVWNLDNIGPTSPVMNHILDSDGKKVKNFDKAQKIAHVKAKAVYEQAKIAYNLEIEEIERKILINVATMLAQQTQETIQNAFAFCNRHTTPFTPKSTKSRVTHNMMKMALGKYIAFSQRDLKNSFNNLNEDLTNITTKNISEFYVLKEKPDRRRTRHVKEKQPEETKKDKVGEITVPATKNVVLTKSHNRLKTNPTEYCKQRKNVKTISSVSKSEKIKNEVKKMDKKRKSTKMNNVKNTRKKKIDQEEEQEEEEQEEEQQEEEQEEEEQEEEQEEEEQEEEQEEEEQEEEEEEEQEEEQEEEEQEEEEEEQEEQEQEQEEQEQEEQEEEHESEGEGEFIEDEDEEEQHESEEEGEFIEEEDEEEQHESEEEVEDDVEEEDEEMLGEEAEEEEEEAEEEEEEEEE